MEESALGHVSSIDNGRRDEQISPCPGAHIRVLDDRWVEVYKGDHQGSFELMEISHAATPHPMTTPTRGSLIRSAASLHVTSIDFPGTHPYVVYGTNEGTIHINRIYHHLPVPYWKSRNVWDSPAHSAIHRIKLNPIDNGLIATLHCSPSDEHYLTVVDIARGKGMREAQSILAINTQEHIADIEWLWRHPSLLAVSTNQALRMLDLRCPDTPPPSLFYSGPASLLTANQYRVNLLAAVIDEEVKIFDNRKLFGPLETFRPSKFFTGPIGTMKWSGNNPNELLYSSKWSNSIGRIDTTLVDEFLSRQDTTFALDDIISMERIWEELNMDPDFLVKRLKMYLPDREPMDFYSYEEQFELSRQDTSYPPPFILNQPREGPEPNPRAKKTSKGHHRYCELAGKRIDILDEEAMKDVPHLRKLNRRDGDNKLLQARDCVAAAVDMMIERRMMKRPKSCEVMRHPESMEEFLIEVPPFPCTYVEDISIGGTLASTEKPRIRNVRMDVEELKLKTIETALSPPQVDVRSILDELSLDENVRRALDELFEKSVPKGEWILTEQDVQAMAFAAQRLVLRQLPADWRPGNASPSPVGEDFGPVIMLDVPFLAFCFTPIGYSGVIGYSNEIDTQLDFIPFLRKDEEVEVMPMYALKFQEMRIRQVFELTPAYVWEGMKEKLMTSFKPGKQMHAYPRKRLLRKMWYENNNALPDWLIWAMGSANYYEGRVYSPRIQKVYAKYKEKLGEKKKKKPPMPRIDEEKVMKEPVSKPRSSTTKSTSKQPKKVGRKSVKKEETQTEKPQKEKEGGARGQKIRAKPMEKEVDDSKYLIDLASLPHYKGLTKNPKRVELRRQFNRFDFSMKGFPGLLQLSAMSLKKKTRHASFDVKILNKIKLYRSNARTRMLIPFALAPHHITREVCLFKFEAGFEFYYGQVLSALLHGKFTLFVQILESMHKKFGAPPKRVGSAMSRTQLMESLLKTVRKLVTIETGPRSDDLTDKRREWLKELDVLREDVNRLMEQEEEEGIEEEIQSTAFVKAILIVLRCGMTGRNPEKYTDSILEVFSFPYRMLWLTCLCDSKTIDRYLKDWFSQAEGIERLMYVGIGQHTDCLNVISSYLYESHEWQLMSLLMISARVFEEKMGYFRTLYEITRKPVKAKKPDETGQVAPVDTKIARKKKKRRLFFYHPKKFNIKKFKKRILGNMRRRFFLARHVVHNGRLPPPKQMNELFPHTYIENDSPIECLMSVARMAVVRFLYTLSAMDLVFLRHHIISIIGTDQFERLPIVTMRFELRCTFCGHPRSKVTKRRRKIDAETVRMRKVLKDRADRRRNYLKTVRLERMARGEPESYEPSEDINGSMVATEQEIRAPPAMACSQCRRPYPKCVICHRNQRTPHKGKHQSGPMARHFAECKLCHHGGHVCHLVEWFEVEKECAVNGCNCRCSQAPFRDTLRSWREEQFLYGKVHQYVF